MHLLLLLSLVIPLYAIFILVPGFQSDEAIYTYAAYAIVKGVIPYSQITLVHPPLMYLAYAVPISLFGPNLLATRTFSSIFFLLTVVLTYFLAKTLHLKHSISLLASALYALYPASTPFASTTLLVNLIMMFSLSSLILYVTRKGKMLFLVGFMMGLALMTWYLALFFFLSLLMYHILSSIWQKISMRKVIIEVATIISGSLIPIMLFLGWISLVWHATTHFYFQTFVLHITREILTVSEKWVSITSYIEYFFPLLLVSLLGTVISILYLKKTISNLFILMYISVSYPLFLILISRTLFIHYLLPITPYLAILSAFSIHTFNKSLSKLRETHLKSEIKLFIVILISLLVIMGIIVTAQKYSFYSHYLQFGYANPHTQVELYIGSRITNLTSPDEKIWTSEPAIAFFAQRLIAPPNSTMWPLQGFFHDVFDAPFVDAYGVVHKGKGFVKPCEFIQAWEKYDVRVIVLIGGSGAVPYPDSVLLEGFEEEQGVKEWVEQNFRLEEIVISPEVSYTYYIWLRGK